MLWNTIYMEDALNQLRAEGFVVRDEDVARWGAARLTEASGCGKFHCDWRFGNDL